MSSSGASNLGMEQQAPSLGASAGNFMALPTEIIHHIIRDVCPRTAIELSKTCRSLNFTVFEHPMGYPWDTVTITLCPHTSAELLKRLCLRVISVKLHGICKANSLFYRNSGTGTSAQQPGGGTFEVAGIDLLPTFPRVTKLSMTEYHDDEVETRLAILQKFPAVRRLSCCPKPGQDDLLYRHVLESWPDLEMLSISDWRPPAGSSRAAQGDLHQARDRFLQFLSDLIGENEGRVIPCHLRELTINSSMLMMDDGVWDRLGAFLDLRNLVITCSPVPRYSPNIPRISNECVLKLKDLKNLTTLELNFGKPRGYPVQLSDECLRALAGLGHLEKLLLPVGKFSSKGLMTFFSAADFAGSVKVLEMFKHTSDEIKITDEVLQAIGRHLLALETISFEFSCPELAASVTNAGLQALVSLSELTRLSCRNRFCCFASSNNPRHCLVDSRCLKPLDTRGADTRRKPVNFALEGPHFKLDRDHVSPFQREDPKVAIRRWCPDFRGVIKSNDFVFTG